MINMKHVIFKLMLISMFLSNAYSNSDDKKNAVNDDPDDEKKSSLSPPTTQNAFKNERPKTNCWNEFNITQYFELMDDIDDRYAEVRQKYQETVESENFDKEMLDMMLKTRGAAESAIHRAAGNPAFIPAGMNLGGYCMIKLQDSFFFFHRMKLRNNTHFRIDFLHNDLANMVLTANLSLNDLHIVGAYERALNFKDSSELFYAPTFGEVEFLLRNVQYTMEGRYRLLRDKLWIELIVSDVTVSDILMMYINKEKANKPFPFPRENIDSLLGTLKTNLDKWLQDYINDHLMYFAIAGSKTSSNFLKYDQEKTIALNKFVDYVLERIKKRIKQLFEQNAKKLQNFSITAVNGMKFKLTNGVLRGLDTIHRRSFATCKKDGKLRKVDTIVGFSSLKVEYSYAAVFHTEISIPYNNITVSADDLIAHMSVTLTKDPETLGLIFDSIQHIKPETLTLRTNANVLMGTFKYLLEKHIFTYISNYINHNIRMLHSIIECGRTLEGYFTKIPRLWSEQALEDENEE